MTGAGATATRRKPRPASSRSSGCKAPLTGETVIEDQVQGRVVWQNADLDDLVLLRSDGTPTYMLAVVVDDHDMNVTHIIRGDDHLTNGARQKHIYEALGWNVPIMAHIPLIHGPDGSKLSKRHGALGVDAYRAMGYLPAAMRNYLVRLGWAHGDQEIFTTEEMIAAFDLPQIGRSPARFDFAKLESLNGHYIRASADADLIAALEELLPHIAGGQELASKMTPALRAKLLTAMPALKERAKTLVELFDATRFLWASRPLDLNDQAKALLTPEAKSCTAALLPELAAISRLDPGGDRDGGARLCRTLRPQARRGGATAARRAHRAHHLAADFRRAGRAGQGRKPGPVAGSGGPRLRRFLGFAPNCPAT